MRLRVNYACSIGTRLNLDLLCVAQNGVVLELRRNTASQNSTLASLQTNGLKGAATTKVISFCAWSSSISALVCKLWFSMRKKKKEERWRNRTFSSVCFSAPVYSMVCLRVFLWTARQYHSLCTLGLGFVASLAIIRVIHNYGKFKISVAIPK